MSSPPPPVSGPGGEHFTVRLRVDGRELTLKPFLHDLLGGALEGLVSGLRGVEAPRRVEIQVERIPESS